MDQILREPVKLWLENGKTEKLTSIVNETLSVSEENVYHYYTKHLYPAIMSSMPILVKQLFDDTRSLALDGLQSLKTFILPKWKSNDYHPELPAFMTDFWKNQQSLLASPLSIAEFMLRNFDTNEDGHISSGELAEIMKHWPMATKAHVQETWSVWLSREWPLMDWKIGILLWRTFSGILFLIAVLSIIPGRSHSISAKILRWPILGLTYFLISVELIVYIVIRIFIRLAEYLFAVPKHRKLRQSMSEATTYRDWYKYANALDKSQKRDVWLDRIDDNTYYRYNWGFIRVLIKEMRKARSKKDSLLALAVVQQCTRKNVGGVMSEDLFSYSNTGEPKRIVSDFVNELCLTLRWIANEASNIQIEHDIINAINTSDDKIKLTKDIQEQDLQLQDHQEKDSFQLDKILHSLIHGSLGWIMKAQDHSNKISSHQIQNLPIEKCNTHMTKLSFDEKEDDEKLNAIDKNVSNRNNSGSQSSKDECSKTSNKTPENSVAGFNQSNFEGNDNSSNAFSALHREEVVEFLLRARQAYGRTALCLSGGAMMGLYHFGHVLGLLESGVLPSIISGTSGGSVVGAIICTRTDDELLHDLDPQVLIHHLKCFQRPWSERLKSVWRTGNLFDFDEWMELIQWFTCGQTTFEEAFKKTGRIFCVTLSSTIKKAPPVLVNYLTAPNVTIASAVIASAAVPGFVPPVRLQFKDKRGIVRSQEGETYFDGSIEQDIPVNGLAEMLNCQFFIACQCNPHIVPFFYNSKGGVGRPCRWSSGTQEHSWRGGFLLAALEMYLKNDMKAKLRFLHDLEAAVGFTSTLMTQEFVGSTTIVPQVSFIDYFKLFSDPDINDLYRYIQSGKVAAYEHTALIKLHYSVADILDDCIQKLDKTNEIECHTYSQKRSIISIAHARDALSFSPPYKSKKCTLQKSKHSNDSLSSHMDSDNEDEFERDWVNGALIH